MIPPRNKETDIATDIAQGKRIKDKIMNLSQEVTDRFLQGENLNEAIAAVAKRDSLNRLMIQRLVEESNTVAYNKRYEQVKAQKDRRIQFQLAELGLVLEQLGNSAPPELINPNLVTGPKGDGEMQKAANYEVTPLHRPLAQTRKRYETQLEKSASYDKMKQKQQVEANDRFVQSGVFKIANVLVQSEKLYKNANYVFNTMLSDAEWSDELTEQLVKKASELAELSVKTRRARPSFKLHLSADGHQKAASFFLGEHSLLKEAQEQKHVQEIKVAPTSDLATYQQLIQLAKKIRDEHEHKGGE